MLGGVCAGIGEHLDVDPTVVRLVWAACTLFSLGFGLVLYLIAWFIIPDEDAAGTEPYSAVQR